VGGTGKGGWHRQKVGGTGKRWVAPAKVTEPRGHATNRRMHKPPFRRAIAEGISRLSAGQAIRLHLVSGDPPDPEKPHIRLAGRIGCQAPQR